MTWVCYAQRSNGEYSYRKVYDANSFEEAKAFYDAYGRYTFMAAEPMEDAIDYGVFDEDEDYIGDQDTLRERVETLIGKTPAPVAVPVATTPGSKKPPRLLHVQDFIEQIDPQELARRAWNATLIAAGDPHGTRN